MLGPADMMGKQLWLQTPGCEQGPFVNVTPSVHESKGRDGCWRLDPTHQRSLLMELLRGWQQRARWQRSSLRPGKQGCTFRHKVTSITTIIQEINLLLVILPTM